MTLKISLPYPDFFKSLNCLTPVDLKNQVVNIKLTLGTIEQLERASFLGRGKIGFGTNPTVIMWEHNHDALKIFFNMSLMCCEAIGHKLTWSSFPVKKIFAGRDYPWWFNTERYHESQKSFLIRKNPDFYAPQFKDTPNDIEYLVPKIVDGKQEFVVNGCSA